MSENNVQQFLRDFDQAITTAELHGGHYVYINEWCAAHFDGPKARNQAACFIFALRAEMESLFNTAISTTDAYG